jgi:hypothetical protein
MVWPGLPQKAEVWGGEVGQRGEGAVQIGAFDRAAQHHVMPAPTVIRTAAARLRGASEIALNVVT